MTDKIADGLLGEKSDNGDMALLSYITDPLVKSIIKVSLASQTNIQWNPDLSNPNLRDFPYFYKEQ